MVGQKMVKRQVLRRIVTELKQLKLDYWIKEPKHQEIRMLHLKENIHRFSILLIFKISDGNLMLVMEVQQEQRVNH